MRLDDRIERKADRMEIANIQEAGPRLSKLVEQAMRGEEVILARAGQPMVRLVPIHPDESARQGGQWKGRVRIAEDFDVLPEDVAEALGMGAE